MSAVDVADRTSVHQVCSILLRYPDAHLLELLPSLGDAVAETPPAARKLLSGVLDHWQRTDLIGLQRHYVEIFDMRRKCSPYLTYWTHGDTRNRGMALLHFKQVYREAGMTIDESELPDHLAVVLEFAATGDATLGNALLAEHRDVIALLHDALGEVGSPYADVLEAVLSTTAYLTAEERRRMRELAAQGPPTETVGLAGPVDLSLAPFGVTSSAHSTGARR